MLRPIGGEMVKLRGVLALFRICTRSPQLAPRRIFLRCGIYSLA